MSAATDKTKQIIRETQSGLLRLGHDPKGIDGVWGNNSRIAYNNLIQKNYDTMGRFGVKIIPWGGKLTQPELIKLLEVIKNLGWKPYQIVDLMSCMAWESGETFSPKTKNPKSSATGMIQIMEANAQEMGTTTAALAKMTVVEYLEYVQKYFWRYRSRVKSQSDMYMSILWPAAIGRDESAAIWSNVTSQRQYLANKGIDMNSDGIITVEEAMHKIRNKCVKGFIPLLSRPSF